MKVNGLQLGFNIEETRNKNFNRVFQAVENQLRAWSKRYLSLLAKILIFKTYGLSQILFVASTSMLTKSQESQLNNLIYKFIWNKDMGTNKAPDRIKCTILLGEIKKLGFGMVDYRDIVRSIRIRTILRLLNTENHPLHEIIIKNISSSVVNIKVIKPERPSIDDSILQINRIWGQTINRDRENMPIYIANILLNE